MHIRSPSCLPNECPTFPFSEQNTHPSDPNSLNHIMVLVWRASPFTHEEGSGVMPIRDLCRMIM